MQPLTFNWSEAIYSVVFCFCFVYMCTYVDMYEDTFVCGYTCMNMRLHVQARRQPQMFLRHCSCFSFETVFLIVLELACRLSWLDNNPHLYLPQYLDYSCMLPHLAFITFYFIFYYFLNVDYGKGFVWLVVGGWFSSAGNGSQGLMCATEVHFSPLFLIVSTLH